MKYIFTLLACLFAVLFINAQDLSMGLMVNDLTLRPMQPIAKPAYLGTIIDPSFGTTIRRITNAANGQRIRPMYSTIQPWNADESMMIVYEVSRGHQLLDGRSYEFIRYLDDVNPDDLENIFWDFDDPNILYYLDNTNADFTRYNVNTQSKTVLVNFNTITSNCSGDFSLGGDVQMMSWDSDVVGFRCNNDRAYYYKISTGQVTEFDIDEIWWTAPVPGPSGDRFYHENRIYNAQGNMQVALNESSVEHSCIGKMTNGNDGYFAVAFSEGPSGGCFGNIVAHDMTTGNCFPIISEDQGYDYSQSGTHISAVAHKNTEGGWMAASMMGFERDGQDLLDQELVIAKADQGNIKVCRIGHHRSDSEEFGYWGEPHAAISPTGTRVLFASDWSGSEDGQSVDAYVVELPAYDATVLAVDEVALSFNGTVIQDDILLEWETNLSIDHAYFEIEHSIDGIHFITIGKNDSQKNQLTFKHQQAQKGTNHYRLKQINLDGSFDYSVIITLDFIKKNTLFKYNSTTRALSFNDFYTGEIFIYSADGRLVFQQRNKGESTILDFLNAGIYTVQIISGRAIEAEKIGVF